MKEFAAALQANLVELRNHSLLSDQLSPTEASYVEILIAYLKGDNAGLRHCLARTSDELLQLLGRIRLQILECAIHPSDLHLLETWRDRHGFENCLWEGEAMFLLGLAWCEAGEYELSKKFYMNAHRLLWREGVKKKAVKALLNNVVAESRLNKEKKLIVDYLFVAQKAVEVEDSIVAGICHLNIAQEYRKMGAPESALKSVNKSIEFMQADRGINHFYFSLLERCHIYIDLDRLSEARLDYQIAQESPFPEIKEGLKVIDALLGNHSPIDEGRLDPSWKNRLHEIRTGRKSVTFTKMESQLLELLSAGEATKEHLITSLYGDRIDFTVGENRFKVLLSRMRKKAPSLIISSEIGYHLADETFLLPNRKALSPGNRRMAGYGESKAI